MSDPAVTIRSPLSGELDSVNDERFRNPPRECTVLVCAQGEQARFAGLLDARGRATQPHDPAVTIQRVDEAGSGGDMSGLDELLVRLSAAAEALGANRITIGWDPMDVRGLKILQQHGFRPTGEMPYFEMTGGHVEYISGYMDATGSTMDLARTIGRDS